jgi:hypothetical protein
MELKMDRDRRQKEDGGVREIDLLKTRIPSISTGGAAMNAIIKTEVAVNKVGIIKTPNHPM